MRVWILRLRRYAPPLRMTPEASLHECAVDGLDGLLGIGFVNTGNDVDLRRTLVDDADVHLVVGESGEELCSHTDLVRHAVTDSRDEGDAREHLDTVRAHLLRDVFENHVLHGVESLAIHHDAHGVDSARAQFVGEAFAFEHGEHAAAETDFLVHHGLFDVDHREALTAGDTRNRELCFFRSGADDGARVLRAVRVADVDRNLLRAARGDGFVVEHACAGVGEFADFAVAHVFDGQRIFHNARVSHEHARDVGPVLVLGGIDTVGEDCARNVGTATAEGLDFATEVCTVEARQHVKLVFVRQGLRDIFVGLRRNAVLVVEGDQRECVDEVCAQVLGHEACAQEFATAYQEVGAHGFGLVLELVFEAVEVFGQFVFETQVLADFVVALTDQVPRGRKVEALGGEVVGAVEEVGKLCFLRIALAGCGNDDDLAVLVGFNDGLDLLELAGIGDRAAAELTYDSLTHFFLSGHQTSRLRAQSLSSRPSCPSLPIWPATWFLCLCLRRHFTAARGQM